MAPNLPSSSFGTQANPRHFDVIVIGSGAGNRITRPAANLGYNVAIIEKGPLGGTCLNRGCIPSKMLIHPADIMSTILEEAPKFGIQWPNDAKPTIDRAKLVQEVCEEVDADSASIKPNYDKHPNITLFSSECQFAGPKTILIKSTSEYLTADKIFICVGCRAQIPDIDGLQGTPYITYEKALRLTETPESMIVIGGGYIATELGYYMARMGTKVDFVVRSKMLNGEDHEIQDLFEQNFTSRFNVHLSHRTDKVSYKDGTFHVTVTQTNVHPPVTKTLCAKSLFLATGVTPNTDTLAPLPAPIKLDSQGFIQVDSAFRTGQEGVYAYGDVIGRHLFRHTANWEGEWVFKSLFHKDAQVRERMQREGAVYPPIPHAVFTNPQIGGVGLTEEQALKTFASDCAEKDEEGDNNSPLIIGRCDVADVAMGAALRTDSTGRIKLIFRKKDKRLVGAHMIGPEASTVIHCCIAYMQTKATIEDLMGTIWIHPSLCEVVRDAARDADEEFRKMGERARM
ncbi:hypothetical protein HDV05_000976 [Chytridiales sp. JEL 0842]|nr:hypothetical protein HDV05_000976 [Chytridiales sp. JEL 0842]